MLLDAAAAKALFAIVLSSTQGLDALTPQLPLHVEDRGESWLVTGTPYTDAGGSTRYRMCHALFAKGSAQVTGIECHARMVPTEAQSAHWRKIITPRQFEGVFGPPQQFEPRGIRDLWLAAYGGLVNTPTDAIEYAFVLMQANPGLAVIPKSALKAVERERVWHVTAQADGSSRAHEVLSFSRIDGKVIAGDL